MESVLKKYDVISLYKIQKLVPNNVELGGAHL